MRKQYLLVAAATLALAALVTLILVFVRAGDDDEPAAPETATPTLTRTATPVSTPTATDTPVTPTSTATTPATATPTSPPSAGVLIEHGDRASNLVALTFDMGGRVDPALDIMQWLIDKNVHATIFMTGAMAENQNTDAGREVLRLVDAHPALFDLGNHSYSHPDFRNLTREEMAGELQRTETALARHTSRSPRPFFRPPLGGQDADVVQGVAAVGYPYTIMWDIDTIDWRPESEGGPTADAIVTKVLANAQGGSIVLMHLGGYNTFEALPAILLRLRAEGLEPVTLSQLLGIEPGTRPFGNRARQFG